jgi:hypothetical protein
MVTFNNRLEAHNSFGNAMPLAKVEAKRGRLVCSAVPAPGQPRQWDEVPVGTRVIPDYGARFVGGISFNPSVSELTVLDGEPMPSVPEGDGRTWQDVLKFPLLIEGRGLFMYSVTGPVDSTKRGINMPRNATYVQLWKLCPEAQAGKLQECILRPFELVPTVNGDFYGLVWEPTSTWIDRDPDIFGPRLTPPPPPMMPPQKPQPKLPSDTEQVPMKLEVAAEPPIAAKPEVVAAKPTEPAKPAPEAANDPLARYRPAGAGRKPY